MDKPTISQPPANLPLRSSPSTFADNREDYLTWEQASGFPSIQDAVDYVEFGIGQVESDIAETAANANAAEAAQALAEAARVASLADLFADTTAFLASGDADGIVPEAGVIAIIRMFLALRLLKNGCSLRFGIRLRTYLPQR